MGELDAAGSPDDATGTTVATTSAGARAEATSAGAGAATTSADATLPNERAATTSVDETSASPRAAPTIVLLEPDTEGRLAADLARHGEGPVALYITLPSGAFSDGVARLALLGVRVSSGPGPFGAAIAVAGAPASSPSLILVPFG